MMLVKDGKEVIIRNKEDFIQERLVQWGVCSRGERSGPTPNTIRTMEIYSQGAGWGSGWKTTRGNIKASRILDEGRLE